jgi:CBS domain-containing protein
MKDVPVSRVMNQKLLTAAPEESLTIAMMRMAKHGVHHLLVLDQGRVAGILSSADELKLALLRLPTPSCDERPASES